MIDLFQVLGGFDLFLYALLMAVGIAGSIDAASNPELTLGKKIAWTIFNLIPITAIFYFMRYHEGGVISRIFNRKGIAFTGLTNLFLRRLSYILFIPMVAGMFYIPMWLGEYNSRDMLKDHINSYWAQNFDEMNRQSGLSFDMNRLMKATKDENWNSEYIRILAGYDAFIKDNPKDAYAYYKRGKLKEEANRKTGVLDLKKCLDLVSESLRKENDTERLIKLGKFRDVVMDAIEQAS